MEILRRFGTKRSKASASTSISTSTPPQSKSAEGPSPFLYKSNHTNNNNHTANPFTTPSTTATRRPPPPLSPSNDMTGAPPPYSASPSQNTPAAFGFGPTIPVATDDSPYSFLREFDTVFLIDDSGSMAGRSWHETMAALSAIAPICTSHDADGIDVYFLNHRNPTCNHSPFSSFMSSDSSTSNLGGYTNLTTTAAVQNLFQTVRPLGGTPTGTRLNQLLKPYLAQLKESLSFQGQSASGSASGSGMGRHRDRERERPVVKPLNIIVITDGVPSDDVESVIVSAARKLDSMGAEPWQVGIQFFQVGSEPEAAENLRDLDDALAAQYGIRDMVDTVPFGGAGAGAGVGADGQESSLTAQGLLKVCLGSVVRRHDRRGI